MSVCDRMPEVHKLKNSKTVEIFEKHPLLGKDKHKFPTAMYLHSSRRTVEGGAFVSVCNKAIYREPTNQQRSPECLSPQRSNSNYRASKEASKSKTGCKMIVNTVNNVNQRPVNRLPNRTHKQMTVMFQY